MVSLLTSDAFLRGLTVGLVGGVLWLTAGFTAGMVYDISIAGYVWMRILGLFGYSLMIAGPALAALDIFMGIGRVLFADDADDEWFEGD